MRIIRAIKNLITKREEKIATAKKRLVIKRRIQELIADKADCRAYDRNLINFEIKLLNHKLRG